MSPFKTVDAINRLHTIAFYAKKAVVYLEGFQKSGEPVPKLFLVETDQMLKTAETAIVEIRKDIQESRKNHETPGAEVDSRR
tara:strand:- start:309 stop:554 length:246 start_codon:yes stop_codon:yes gene_type:complete